MCQFVSFAAGGTMASYSLEERATPNSLEYRVFFSECAAAPPLRAGCPGDGIPPRRRPGGIAPGLGAASGLRSPPRLRRAGPGPADQIRAELPWLPRPSPARLPSGLKSERGAGGAGQGACCRRQIIL